MVFTNKKLAIQSPAVTVTAEHCFSKMAMYLSIIGIHGLRIVHITGIKFEDLIYGMHCIAI